MSRAMTGPDLSAIASGCLASGAILALPAPPALALAGVVLAVMIAWIAWQDVRTFTIPDGPLLALSLTGVALRLSGADNVTGEMVAIGLDAGLCGGALLAIREAYYRLKGFDGLGFGDVKLAAAGGILVGTLAFAHALLAASALGLAVVLVLAGTRPAVAVDRLPFGALLAPACGLVWILSLVGPAG